MDRISTIYGNILILGDLNYDTLDKNKGATLLDLCDIIQLFHTFLCNSQNYHPRGAPDDSIHCCQRPKAEGNSASGHPQHRGVIDLTVAQKGVK